MAHEDAIDPAPRIRLPIGTVDGVLRESVIEFRGIPYAAPPVGARRFGPPQPPEPDQLIETTTNGMTAPQRLKPLPGLDLEPLIGSGWVPGDNYLTLNVWRPRGGGAGLPVMVFVHGGGFVIGSKDPPVQNGANFARDGVICVAMNYRLGVDGFLPVPGVPTNLGLRDVIAALKWVRDHIAAFDGDPDNVTVFGESAGAMAIADLMTSPLATGLFRRAIIQSGHGAMTRDVGVAQRLVRKLAKLLQVTPDAAGFRSVDPDKTLDAIEKVSRPTTRLDLRDADGREPVFGISRFIPVHGDDVLPEPPLDALAKGAGAEVDLLIGTNTEEMNLYLVPTGVRDKIGRLLATWLVRRSLPQARKVLKAYGMGRKGVTPGQALTDALTDLVFRWPARRFAEEHRGRTHMYEFDWRSPLFGRQLGAAHSVELPFVFDTLACVTGPEGLCGPNPPQELATRIHRLWVKFATNGSVPWPEFSRDARHVHHLDADRTIIEPLMPAAPFLP